MEDPLTMNEERVKTATAKEKAVRSNIEADNIEVG